MSRFRKRGEYRATMSSENRVAERAQGLETEQKNRHLTGGLGASEALFARASGGKADAMTGDISARRGALPIKNQRRLTTLKWLMTLNYSRGAHRHSSDVRRMQWARLHKA
jgi:hypothetical protein